MKSKNHKPAIILALTLGLILIVIAGCKKNNDQTQAEIASEVKTTDSTDLDLDSKEVTDSDSLDNDNKETYPYDKSKWTKTTLTLSEEMAWVSYCYYANGKYVAILPESDKAAYSTDGTNWKTTTMPSKERWKSICYGNGKFVAVGRFSDIAAYSTDGINWKAAAMPSDDNRWNSVCYGNGKFVAVAGNKAAESNKAAYSTDGINWKSATMPGAANWNSVCYGNGKFVAVSRFSEIAIAYSTDGINWKAATTLGVADWTMVCYGNGKFVVKANYSGIAAYSTNGIEWETTDVTSNMWLNSICYGNGKFVAVYERSSFNDNNETYNYVVYSIDGIKWTIKRMPFNAGFIDYRNGKFVALSHGGTIYMTDNIE